MLCKVLTACYFLLIIALVVFFKSITFAAVIDLRRRGGAGKSAWRHRSADRFVLLAARADKNTDRGREQRHQTICYPLFFCLLLSCKENSFESADTCVCFHSHIYLSICSETASTSVLFQLLGWRSMPSEKTFKQRRTLGRWYNCLSDPFITGPSALTSTYVCIICNTLTRILLWSV